MAIGISNRWPAPPSGYLTTKGVIELGTQLVAAGEVKHPIPQPQILLTWLNATPAAKRKAGFPEANGKPVGKRNLRRGPGPRGGRYEWPVELAVEIQRWYSARLEKGTPVNGATSGNGQGHTAVP
jgi:hypothetical protein